jgi:phosphoribosyl 1,2-cyclic phosphodiesterase
LIVNFWGTRGSLPVAITPTQIRTKLVQAIEIAESRQFEQRSDIINFVENELDFEISGTYGGNTSCLHIEATPSGKEHLILDMGSGARPLANSFIGRYGYKPQTYHILMSHLHWDHIMGFPFFVPAYIPGNKIIIHGCHAHLERAFRRQQGPISFPVDISEMHAQIEFNILEPNQWHKIADFEILPKLQLHAGDSYGYRIEQNGKSLIYTTDSEHIVEDHVQRAGFIEFFWEADLVVFDSMYSLADAITMKADWGHSSNIIAVELCQIALCKKLCLFHHEPAHNDQQITKVLNATRRFEQITRNKHILEIVSAYDELSLKV